MAGISKAVVCAALPGSGLVYKRNLAANEKIWVLSKTVSQKVRSILHIIVID